MRKILAGILTLLLVGGILFLTLQGPEDTMALSNGVKDWLGRHGIQVTSVQIRHYAHYPMYFLLGVALWLWLGGWRAAVTGTLIGAMDEVLKNFLPTREFDLSDLGRDAAAVLTAVGLCALLLLIRRRMRTAG